MKAIRMHAVGDPSVLRLDDIADPAPGPDEVVLRVTAAGVNHYDTQLRRGIFPVPRLPYILGGEVAGVIEQVGAAVQGVPLGLRVMALVEHGGYAERVAVAADELLPIPAGMSDVEAAAFQGQGLTAWAILRVSARLEPGEIVVIHAAAGGVGTLAVQLARLLRAGRVIAAASSAAKLEVARSLGADVGINYTQEALAERVREETEGRGADVVLASVGGALFTQSLDGLAPWGRLVVYGLAGGPPDALEPLRLAFQNQSVVGFFAPVLKDTRPALYHAGLTEMLEHITAGRLHVVVGHRFPLSEAAVAHEQMGQRATIGKIVLVP
jgi:NADPH2:quinone reductase